MYIYRNLRTFIFTEEGQGMFLSIRDKSKKLLKIAGIFTMGAVIRGQCGDSWEMMACVDRLVEIGEIVEVNASKNTAGQHRVFIKNATV